MVEETCKYCPKCGSNLWDNTPDFKYPLNHKSRKATKYLYCKKCDRQILSQEKINFCTVCGRKVEKVGYLCYEGPAADNLVTEWPITKKQCRECFLNSLKYIVDWYDYDASEAAWDIIGKGGLIVGGVIGFIYGGIFWAIILGVVSAVALPAIYILLLMDSIRGKPYEEISDDKADYIKKKYETIQKSSIHDSISNVENKGSIISAILWMSILSILLGWIPILGSLIAGYVGGKKAGSVSNAVIAVILPAVLLAILIYTVFSGLPIIGAFIAGATFTIVIIYNLILLFGAVVGGASVGA